MLSPDEFDLFRERIRFMDKKIQPGLTKLLWFSKGASNVFIRECLLHVDKVVTQSSSLPDMGRCTFVFVNCINLYFPHCLLRFRLVAEKWVNVEFGLKYGFNPLIEKLFSVWFLNMETVLLDHQAVCSRTGQK